MNNLEKLKGKFISFEGVEGAGKSTQSKLLVEYLNKNSIKAVWTREPGGSEGAEEIRKVHGYTTTNWKKRREQALLISQVRRGICKECGKEYQVTNVHQKYCCPKCRKRANTRDSKKEHICEICGTVFIAPTYYSRTTCSNECAHKASVANRKRRSI